jgi:MTH538 TIR-like domain (DUF1863)
MEPAMSKRIFVSYAFKEKEVAHTLDSWFNRGGGPCQGEPVFVLDASARTWEAIDAAILSKMQTCHVALFLTSETVHNNTWIDREAQLAESLGLPIVAIPLKGSPAGLPNRLKDKKRVTLVDDWSSTALCSILNAIQLSSST